MGKKLKFPDHLKKALEVALAAGWKVRLTGSNHWQWLNPDGRYTTTCNTSGYPRSNKNDIARLRRNGLDI